MHKIYKDSSFSLLHKFGMFDVIAIEAALCGNSKGTLYVDYISNPQVLLLWNEFDGFYLSADKQFDYSLISKAITQIIEADTSENSEYVLYIDPKHDNIVSSIIPAKNYEKLDVLGYFISPTLVEVKHVEGFEIIDIGRDFFSTSYTNAQEILTTISQTWHSTDDFCSSGFGVAVIEKSSGTVAAFCVTEHVTDSGAEFSIETLPEFQKKGLATLAGKSMLSSCKKRRKDAYWYCTPDNTASIRLAEKLGFTQRFSFHVWLFEM